MDPQSNEWPTRPADRLRAALEPASGSPERLVRAALGEPRGASRINGARDARERTPLRLWAALASAAALAGLLILALPRRWGSTGDASRARISISNQGGVVLACRSGEGRGWLVRADPAASTPGSKILIIRHGEP